MDTNITYILGAGASAKALPTVKKTEKTEGLADAFVKMADEIKIDKEKKYAHHGKYDAFLSLFDSSLRWLAEKTNKFGTPDTFAKYLYLKDRNKLDVLKDTLSLFFIIRQFFNNCRDERALIFLTTILKNAKEFPNNIKIINWNYDFQIQLAATQFLPENLFVNKSNISYTPSLIKYYPYPGREDKVNVSSNYPKNEFSMVHLNGIAGYYLYNLDATIQNSFIDNDFNNFDELLEKITDSNEHKGNLLTFAWETEFQTFSAKWLRLREYLATSLVDRTEILVIIGYSFPLFNREIDKKIFSSLKTHNTLKKIYFQDPVNDGRFLRNQFDLSSNIDIEPVKNTDNYFVPNEL